MRFPPLMASLLALTLGVKGQNPPVEKETILGAQLAARVRQNTIPFNLPAAENYATNIGLRLAPSMPISSLQWHFTFIRNPQPSPAQEPISLPGGWIFIPAQLILASHTEAEFAAILAHAMAHVALRQMTRQVPGGPSGLASIPLIFIGGPAFAKDPLRFEVDADQTAIKALDRTGFDLSSLLTYLERTDSRTSLERLSNLRQTIQAQPVRETYIVSTHLFQSIQEKVQQQLSSSPETRKLPSLFNPKL